MSKYEIQGFMKWLIALVVAATISITAFTVGWVLRDSNLSLNQLTTIPTPISTIAATVTPKATVSSTVSPNATASPAITSASNLFDPLNAKVGDKVGAFTVTSVAAFNTNEPISKNNFKVDFSGQADIAGSYKYTQNPAIGGLNIITLEDLSADSKKLIPTITGTGDPIVNFSNDKDLKTALDIVDNPNADVDETVEGRATITIKDIVVSSYPSEAPKHQAEFVKLVSKN